MEEVWKDINLSSLQSEVPATPPLCHLHNPSSAAAAGIILQDFLAHGPPLNNNNKAPYHHPPPPHPTIDLNLDYASSHHHSHPNPQQGINIIGPISPQLRFCPTNRKRVIEQQQQQQQQMSDGLICNGISDDDDNRRNKRMIKNRESAARSRARKQAYTNELELEVAHLVQENSKLRRKYEELRSAMAAQMPARKHHQRASSAPI